MKQAIRNAFDLVPPYFLVVAGFLAVVIGGLVKLQAMLQNAVA